MLTWLRDRLARVRRGRTPPPHVEVEPGGFAIVAPDGRRYPVRWASVTRLVAYKRDNLTTDEVMLAVEVAERPGRVQEVSEEWPGFADLLGPMERELGVSPAWYVHIIQPAFAANVTRLFDRETGARWRAPDEPV